MSYRIYWSVFCMLLGILVAPMFYEVRSEDHSLHLDPNHKMGDHKMLEVDPNNAPSVDIKILKDSKSGWNLQVDTENFNFTPEKIDKPNQANEGHAHIYVNGLKLTRLYGHHYHLAEFPVGTYEVSVSLNANDHSMFALNGKPIEAKVELIQEAKAAVATPAPEEAATTSVN